MSTFVTLLFAAPVPAPYAMPRIPLCRPAQLRLTLDGRDGDFDGMSHSGTELSFRNTGAGCMLPALPAVAFRDVRGHVLSATRRAPPGPRPGPVMASLRLAAGHRVATHLRWVSGAVFPSNRSIHAASVTVRIGTAMLRAPLKAILYGEAGKPLTFDQPPLRAVEGLAAG